MCGNKKRRELSVHAAFYLEGAFIFFFFAFLGRDLPKVPR